MINLPNVITLGRVVLVPVIVWLLLEQFYEYAFWLFLIACISDGADGFIAKKFNLKTELGGYLDPLADKALLVSVFVTLGIEGHVQTWLVIIVVFRDILILLGALLYRLLYQNLSIEPLFVSKLNTLFQFTFCSLVLVHTAFAVIGKPVLGITEYVVGITTVMSGTSYVILWVRRAIEMEHQK